MFAKVVGLPTTAKLVAGSTVIREYLMYKLLIDVLGLRSRRSTSIFVGLYVSMIFANPLMLSADTPRDEGEARQVVLPTSGQAFESPLELLRTYEFVINGDLDALRRHLSSGVSANATLADGWPLLHQAAIANADEAAKVLLEFGAKLDHRHGSETALELAIALGNWNVAAVLAHGDDQAIATSMLLAAIGDQDLVRLKAFLESGINPNGKALNGGTPLTEATVLGNREVLSALLAAGADPNAHSEDGIPPLLLAVIANDSDTIKLLIKAGADPDEKVDGMPLLSVAVSVGENAVKALIDAGARTDIRNSDGFTPADLAWAMNKTELAVLIGEPSIAERAAPVDKVTLVQAVAAMDHRLIEEALKHESPNQVTDTGVPLVHIAAAEANDLRVFQVFVRDGRYDWVARDRNGLTLFDAIMSNGDPELAYEMLKLLAGNSQSRLAQSQISAILRSRARDGSTGFTRLIAAVPNEFSELYLYDPIGLFGHTNLVRLLDVVDDDGTTPLEVAVINGATWLVRKLIASGASADGYSPSLQDIARSQKDWATLNALPFDRLIPPGFKKGANADDKKYMQQALNEWGYYTGPIDGDFGPGSRAALINFLSDIELELRGRAEVGSLFSKTKFRIVVRNHKPNKFGDVKYSMRIINESCEWVIIDWYQEERTVQSESFVGCVRPNGEAWNANGFAIVKSADGNRSIRLFGDDGWKGDVPIR